MGSLHSESTVNWDTHTTLHSLISKPSSYLQCPPLSKISIWNPRLGSTSKSTWSCTHLTCISLCLRTSPVLTSRYMVSPRGSAWLLQRRRITEKLISYQILRGGRVTFQAINKPNLEGWGTAVEAMEASLELERTVNESLLAMHKVADGHGDAQMTDFIEGTFLKEQVDAIKEIGDLITKMRRAGDGLGLHIIDKELQ